MIGRILENNESEESWISIADLMAALMMVFLLVLLSYTKIIDKSDELSEARAKIIQWADTEARIFHALEDEFGDDLKEWQAVIDEDLTIRFRSPDILFESGRADLEDRFQEILDEFIPAYINLLRTKFPDAIEEIRIEGHTSSVWKDAETQNEAFIKNMGLSQARTTAVLEYSLNLPGVQRYSAWMRKNVSANGLSSAELITGADGTEDKERSRRVEFRIITGSQQEILKAIEEIVPYTPKAFQ